MSQVPESPVQEIVPPSYAEATHEIRRKLFHFSACAIPAGYYLTDRTTALFVIGSLLGAAVIVEYVRMVHAPFNVLFHRIFGTMLRSEEAERTSGATYLLISSFLVILAFHRDIAVLCLLYLIFGDGIAALVGRRFGTHRIFDKTLEGSLAFLVTCVLISVLLPAVPFWIRLIGAILAAGVELIPMRASDNLRIPIISGSVMELLFVFHLRQHNPSSGHEIVVSLLEAIHQGVG